MGGDNAVSASRYQFRGGAIPPIVEPWNGGRMGMTNNERSGNTAGKIAAKALREPGSLSEAEIKTLAASVLTQRPDRPKPAAKAASKPKPRAR